MRLIDADALMETIGITKECKDCAKNGMRGCSESSAFVWACESITEAPTIDAVQVVRCKDCEYIGPLSPTDDYNTCKHKRAMVYAPADGFCCWGERRTDETIRE